MHPASAFSAPPLTAPGQWHLRGGLPPVAWLRVLVHALLAGTLLLAMAWAWAWAQAGMAGQVHGAVAATCVLVAMAWSVVALRLAWRLRRPAAALCLRWCPGDRSGTAAQAHWRVLHWGDRPVSLAVVMQLSGWRLLRVRQASPDPRLHRLAWCWLPPMLAGSDPQDLHRLSCLLTLNLGQASGRAPAMASSGPRDQKVPVPLPFPATSAPETQFPDTVFADTVWMGEPGLGSDAAAHDARRLA